MLQTLLSRAQTPAAPVLKRTKKRKEPADGPYIGPGSKRGRNAVASGSNAGASTSSSSAPGAAAPERKSKNTAVYVTGLPADTDVDEICTRFGKFGLIEEDDAGDPKVKLYAREDDGGFSGDALVVYFREESVELAIAMLDDAELRPGEPATRMRVQRAEFGHKHEGGGTGAASGGGGAGEGKPRPRKTIEDKKRATRRIGKMQKCVLPLVLRIWCSQGAHSHARARSCLTGSSASGTTRTGSGRRSRRRTRRTLRTSTGASSC